MFTFPFFPHKKPCTGLATPKAFCFSYMGSCWKKKKPCASKFSGLIYCCFQKPALLSTRFETICHNLLWESEHLLPTLKAKSVSSEESIILFIKQHFFQNAYSHGLPVNLETDYRWEKKILLLRFKWSCIYSLL